MTLLAKIERITVLAFIDVALYIIQAATIAFIFYFEQEVLHWLEDALHFMI